MQLLYCYRIAWPGRLSASDTEQAVQADLVHHIVHEEHGPGHVARIFKDRDGQGNFIYIAASDLIPEVKNEADFLLGSIHFLSFMTGLGLLLGIRLIFGG